MEEAGSQSQHYSGDPQPPPSSPGVSTWTPLISLAPAS